ncbi:hypothetical protein FGO68_gene3789 [Halteria grandinella]|uniref:Cytosol aminopeptidase domain-containing protein n=1 Tax=Halteria grandinella TaxID=5974 RepID=A0A8J8NT64_HALGN|nr:hypothetical protein FGO68_gene3789 [Halteria grandinella]
MQAQTYWLADKIRQVQSGSPDVTVAIIITKEQVKSASAESFLGHLYKSKDFRQDLNLSSSAWFYHPETLRRILVVQINDGKEKKDARQGGAKAAQDLMACKLDICHVIVSDEVKSEHIGILANSFYLTNFEFSYKTDPKSRFGAEAIAEGVFEEDKDPRKEKFTKKIAHVVISTMDSENVFCDPKYAFWIAAARGAEFCRNVANVRGSTATPDYMEEVVRKLIEGKPQIKDFRVVKGQQLVDLNMNLLHAVGKSATSEPRCITVYYNGNPDKDTVDVSFIGKGVTFDTGGLHLKPSGGIELMYLDKGGACSVLGALHGALELGIKLNVVFAFGLAENSIDGASYKPMDILTSMKGYTVEIDNTDCEGRLILADMFTYVHKEFKPAKIVDLATLTGAVVMALGMEYAGLFSNDDDFANEITQTGQQVFEKYWRLPIPDESREQTISPTADLVNSFRTPFAGASRAAAFLEKFVEKGVKWVHLDIAGAFGGDRPKPPNCAGGNGFGTHTLLQYLWNNQAQ